MKIMLNQLRRIIKEEVQKTMDEMGARRAKLPGAPRAKLPDALSRKQKEAFESETGIDLDSKIYLDKYNWDKNTKILSLAWDEAEPGEDQQYTKYKWNKNFASWQEVYVED